MRVIQDTGIERYGPRRGDAHRSTSARETLARSGDEPAHRHALLARPAGPVLEQRAAGARRVDAGEGSDRSREHDPAVRRNARLRAPRADGLRAVSSAAARVAGTGQAAKTAAQPANGEPRCRTTPTHSAHHAALLTSGETRLTAAGDSRPARRPRRSDRPGPQRRRSSPPRGAS